MGECIGRLETLFSRTSSLPHLPTTTLKLLDTLNSEDASVYRVEQIISGDPGLAACVLRLANSAWALSSAAVDPDVTTISAALLRIGLRSVRALALSTLIRDVIPVAPGFDRERFARHSLFTATLARYTFARHGGSIKSAWDQEEIFAATLLHDLGYPVLAHVAPAVFDRAWQYARRKGLTLSQAFSFFFERRLGELASLTCNAWRLPEFFPIVMKHFEEPWAYFDEHDALCCVAYAEHLAMRFGASIEEWPVVSQMEPEIVERIALPEEEVAALLPLVQQQVDKFLMAPAQAA